VTWDYPFDPPPGPGDLAVAIDRLTQALDYHLRNIHDQLQNISDRLADLADLADLTDTTKEEP
jgi:hypothetical protein